jgi:hypothetical protein
MITLAGWLRRRGFAAKSAVADCPMGAFFVVVSAPILYFFLGVRKAEEPVGVEAFGPDATVEGFDERIVGWLAGSREVQRDAALLGPQVKIARHELAAFDRHGSSAGNPTSLQALSSSSTTSPPRKVNRGCSAVPTDREQSPSPRSRSTTSGEKREKISTIVSTRSLCPVGEKL